MQEDFAPRSHNELDIHLLESDFIWKPLGHEHTVIAQQAKNHATSRATVAVTPEAVTTSSILCVCFSVVNQKV